MYISRAFKAVPVNKLEKPGTEKAKIRKHNNNILKMTSKEQGLQEEPVEYWVSTPTPLLTQQAASIGTRQMPLNVAPVKKVCKQYLKCNNCNINVIAQIPDFIDTDHV